MTTDNANDTSALVPTDRGHAYWQKSHPDHEAAVADVQAKFTRKYAPAPEAESTSEGLPVAEDGAAWQKLLAEANAADTKIAEADLDKLIAAAMKTAEYKKGEPAAVAAVHKLFAEKYPQGQAEHHAYLFEDASLDELTRLAGVRVELPSNHGLNPDHSANLLAFAVNERLPSTTTDSLIEFIFDREVLGGGMREAHEAEFRQAFKGKLTPAQQDLLVKWWRSEVYGGGGA